MVAKVAQDLLTTHDDGPQRTFLEAASQEILDAFTDTFGIYVACFCEDDDLLSQWRGYPAEGGGYALGFDPHPMRSGTGLRLRRIAYDLDEQAEWVREVLDFLASWLSQLEGRRPVLEYACQVALHETVHLLSECLFCFKHPGFGEEKEWRLVSVTLSGQYPPYAPLHFRVSPWTVVPYLELRPNGKPPGEVGPLPIVDAVVGPNSHPQVAHGALRQLLAANGYDVNPRNSSIPLRV